MTATVTAPWDEATVHALNACQHGTGFHGFTCAEHTSTLLGEAREAVEPKTREIGYVSRLDAGYISCAEDVLSAIDRLAQEAP